MWIGLRSPDTPAYWRPRSPGSFQVAVTGDRKSTRLNSSHLVISYAVFCLKKKKQIDTLLQKTNKCVNTRRSITQTTKMRWCTSLWISAHQNHDNSSTTIEPLRCTPSNIT